jgi:hypothetical protein
MQEASCEGRFQVDDWRRRLFRRERHRNGGYRRNHYMSGCTKSTAGMRDVCSRMYVRDLYRGAKNQQQGTAKCKSKPPGLPAGMPHVIFGLLTEHLYNYNVTPPSTAPRRVRAVKKNPFRHDLATYRIYV